jgi:hypothetical protein
MMLLRYAKAYVGTFTSDSSHNPIIGTFETAGGACNPVDLRLPHTLPHAFICEADDTLPGSKGIAGDLPDGLLFLRLKESVLTRFLNNNPSGTSTGLDSYNLDVYALRPAATHGQENSLIKIVDQPTWVTELSILFGWSQYCMDLEAEGSVFAGGGTARKAMLSPSPNTVRNNITLFCVLKAKQSTRFAARSGNEVKVVVKAKVSQQFFNQGRALASGQFSNSVSSLLDGKGPSLRADDHGDKGYDSSDYDSSDSDDGTPAQKKEILTVGKKVICSPTAAKGAAEEKRKVPYTRRELEEVVLSSYTKLESKCPTEYDGLVEIVIGEEVVTSADRALELYTEEIDKAIKSGVSKDMSRTSNDRSHDKRSAVKCLFKLRCRADKYCILAQHNSGLSNFQYHYNTRHGEKCSASSTASSKKQKATRKQGVDSEGMGAKKQRKLDGFKSLFGVALAVGQAADGPAATVAPAGSSCDISSTGTTSGSNDTGDCGNGAEAAKSSSVGGSASDKEQHIEDGSTSGAVCLSSDEEEEEVST